MKMNKFLAQWSANDYNETQSAANCPLYSWLALQIDMFSIANLKDDDISLTSGPLFNKVHFGLRALFIA